MWSSAPTRSRSCSWPVAASTRRARSTRAWSAGPATPSSAIVPPGISGTRCEHPGMPAACAGAQPGVTAAGRRHVVLLAPLVVVRLAGQAHDGVVVGLIGLVEIDVAERGRAV